MSADVTKLTPSQRGRLGGMALAAKVRRGELPKDYYVRTGRQGGLASDGGKRLRTLAEIEADPRGTKTYRENNRGGVKSKQRQEIQGTGAGTCACPHCRGGHA